MSHIVYQSRSDVCFTRKESVDSGAWNFQVQKIVPMYKALTVYEVKSQAGTHAQTHTHTDIQD